MSRAVVLDSATVSLLTQRPGRSPDGDACKLWMTRILATGDRIYLPAIADYEVRRELLRANRTVNLARLDLLRDLVNFIPITEAALSLAARLWADARNMRLQTAPNHSLDIDVILAAQALTLESGASVVVVATPNVDHIIRYVAAAPWQDIQADGNSKA